MDYVQVAGFIIVNTTGVSLERIGDCNTASNGTALINLLHHVILTCNRAELVDLEDTVLSRYVAFAATRVASLANVDGSAIDAVVVTASLIDGAGLISDVVVVHEFEGRQGLTTVAAVIIHGARYDNLRRDADVGPLSVSVDLNTIGEGRGGSVSPARTTVLGYVLVSQVSEEVRVVDIVPHPLLRESHGLQGSLDNWRNGFGALLAARLTSIAEGGHADA